MKKLLSLLLVGLLACSPAYGAGEITTDCKLYAGKASGAGVKYLDEDSARTWTKLGSSAISTTSPAMGLGCLDCTTGASDGASTPDSADFVMGDNEWCFEVKVQFETLPANNTPSIISAQWDSYPVGHIFALYNDGGSYKIRLYFGYSSTLEIYESDAISVSTGTWYDFAVCRDNTGTDTVRLWFDGDPVGTNTTVRTGANSSESFYLARFNDGSTYPFDGLIDEYRFSIGDARYRGTSSYTPSITEFVYDEYTVVLAHFDPLDTAGDNPSNTSKVETWEGTAQYAFGSPYSYVVDSASLVAHYKCDDDSASTTWADSSGNSYNGTGSANTDTYNQGSAIGWGGHYLNTSAYATVAHNTDIDLTGDDWAISFVAKLDTTASVTQYILQKGADNTDGYSIYITSGGVLTVKTNQSSTSQTSNTSDIDTNENLWAIVKDGANITIYKNGVDVTATSGTHTNCTSSSGDSLYLGADSSGSNILDGVIDEVQIYDRALTSAEVRTMYNKMCAIRYDGNSDYNTWADSDDFDVSTNWGAGVWVKFDTHTGVNYIFTQNESTGVDQWAIVHEHGVGAYFQQWSSAGEGIGTTYGGEIADSRWHFIYVARKNGQYWGVYVDTNQVGYADDASVDTFAGTLYLGQKGNNDKWVDGMVAYPTIFTGNLLDADPQSDDSDRITVPTAPYTYEAEGGANTGSQVIIIS